MDGQFVGCGDPFAKCTWLRLLMMAMLYQYAYCFKAGAPAYSCATMTPGHGTSSQTSPSPYTVSADNNADVSGRSVNVIIRSQNNEPFTGYLLKAQSTQSEEILGTFTRIPDDGSSLNCGEIKNSAVTHKNGLLKRGIQAVWEAPPEYEGAVKFVATVVKNYSTFWTEIESLPVRITRDTTSVESGDAKRLKAIQQSIYDGCGVKKQCVGSVDNCVSNRDCSAVATIAQVEGSYLFELMTKSGAYVSAGLSNDTIMANDAVFDCVREDNSVRAYRSWNQPGTKHNERLQEQTDFSLINGFYVDGVIYCKLKVNPTVYVENTKYDLNRDEYYIMLAVGSKLKENNVGYHDILRTTSRDRRQLADFKSEPLVYDVFYEGCGTVKNCFGYPPGCLKTMNCRAVTSVTVQGDKYTFQMQAMNAKYVATGLSEDRMMGADSVAECVQEEGNNRIKAYLSWNIPNAKDNKRVRSQNVVTLVNGNVVNGKLQCTIAHDTYYEVEGQVFSLTNTSYVLLLAAGSSVTSKGVGYHDLVFTASAEKRQLADVAEFSAPTKLLLHLHGSFMVVAWLGTASLGIIFARYFKQTWIGSSFCGKDVWFAWHRFLMVITWILTLASVVIMYIDVGGFVTGPSQTHALLGTITTVLAFIQPIGAAFRPGPDSSRRPIFNWLHWFIGNAAHIIAIVTIFLAVDLTKAELPKLTDYILAAYVCVYVAAHLILSIAGCMSDKSGGIRISSFPMKDINPARHQPHQYERRKDAAYSGFRKFMLFAYVLAITAFCVLIILLIITGRIF